MQNLPFLVTQNTVIQNTPAKNAEMPNAQKPNESISSFKQILSKQVENDAPKKSEQQPTKYSQSQAQLHQTQKVSKAQAKAGKAEVATADEATLSLPSAGLKLGTDDSQQADGAENEVTAVPLQDATALAGIQLPVNIPVVAPPARAALAQDASAELGVQKRLQLDTSLKTALGQATKAISSDEKHSEEKTSDTASQSDAGANNTWLDSVLPKMNRSAEGAEPIVGKVANKLAPETSTQLAEAVITKLKKETVTVTLPSAAAQAIARMDVVQMQAAGSNVIQPSPGKVGWDQAISQKVVWMVGTEAQSATLTLNPPDLGPLQVVINVNNDKADTTFISENPEVRKALENGISTLRGLMDQAGVQLGQANVSTGKQQQDFQQAARERSHQSAANNASSQVVETPVVTRAISRINNGLVDTFA